MADNDDRKRNPDDEGMIGSSIKDCVFKDGGATLAEHVWFDGDGYLHLRGLCIRPARPEDYHTPTKWRRFRSWLAGGR